MSVMPEEEVKRKGWKKDDLPPDGFIQLSFGTVSNSSQCSLNPAQQERNHAWFLKYQISMCNELVDHED